MERPVCGVKRLNRAWIQNNKQHIQSFAILLEVTYLAIQPHHPHPTCPPRHGTNEAQNQEGPRNAATGLMECSLTSLQPKPNYQYHPNRSLLLQNPSILSYHQVTIGEVMPHQGHSCLTSVPDGSDTLHPIRVLRNNVFSVQGGTYDCGPFLKRVDCLFVTFEDQGFGTHQWTKILAESTKHGFQNSGTCRNYPPEVRICNWTFRFYIARA